MMIYQNPTHTNQYLLFDSHHSLEHKLGVIHILQYQAETIFTHSEAKDKQYNHIKEALKCCDYPEWSFIKTPIYT